MDVIEPTPGDPGNGGGGLDLTPRPPTDDGRTPRARSRRRWAPIAVIVLVLAGVGFVAAQALTTATTFFYNADEAVAKQPELGTSRFRIQGTVEPGTIQRDETDVTFKITFNGSEVAVVHRGDPPEMFKDAEPVVLEGHWDETGTHFNSNRMLIKHDENYVAKNEDRLKQADQGGTVPPSTTPASAPSAAP